MSQSVELVCLEPGDPPRLAVRPCIEPVPGDGDVVVRVEASSVNPIDVKRAAGYGQRLLTIKGAGRFPLVLGNDLVGVVDSAGRRVNGLKPGDRVFGLVTTGPRGAHATHVSVDPRWLRPAIPGLDAAAQAVFPYTFTTLWQSLHGAGLSAATAGGMNVLVHGASGGLGQLALQVLSHWGARTTAICSALNIETCRALGAAAIWNRTEQRLTDLPADFDAGLNFGAWEDEAALVSRLRSGALGHATVVHPLLANFDRGGWISGAWRSWGDFRAMRARAAAKGARYNWIVFQPDEEALDALRQLLLEKALVLPVGLGAPLSEAERAFGHVRKQARGRAALLM